MNITGIQIKRGELQKLKEATFEPGELIFATDTKELYVSTKNNELVLCNSVKDAPADGRLYARKDNEWIPVNSDIIEDIVEETTDESTLSESERKERGLHKMVGTGDPTSDNYNNYIDDDGNVSVCIPAFYYRVGSQESPNYSKYRFNTLDICPLNSFENETEANDNDWILHRAFIDDGQVKPYFMIWKYLASRNGDTIQGKKGYEPVCCYNDEEVGSTTGSPAMPNCVGKVYDALTLCRSLGYGWNCTTIFMYSALAMISMAIGQSASSTDDTAWYDPDGVINFPKGCNNKLSDYDDSEVKYTACGNGKYGEEKPLTGSGIPFAKTTHNGKNNGVADINGCVHEITWGITFGGATSVEDSDYGSGFFTLKHSSKFADMTSGWGTGSDAWGNDTHLAKYYDKVTYPGPTTQNYWGSSTASSFFTDKTGAKRDLCGVVPTPNGISSYSKRIDLFGKDQFYYFIERQNMTPFVSNFWNSTYSGGIFNRILNTYRSQCGYHNGFRAARY